MNWFYRNKDTIEPITQMITAIVAVSAVVGVIYQVNANDLTQRTQSARDIYRSFLALSVQNPDLKAPNYCDIPDARLPSYEAYVEYLLYTAEQVLDIDDSWAPVFDGHIDQHAQMFCATPDWVGDTDPVRALIAATRARNCATISPCG